MAKASPSSAPCINVTFPLEDAEASYAPIHSRPHNKTALHNFNFKDIVIIPFQISKPFVQFYYIMFVSVFQSFL